MTHKSISNKLSELFELLKSGALTQEEYDRLKRQILSEGGIDNVESEKKQDKDANSLKSKTNTAISENADMNFIPASKKHISNKTIIVITSSIILFVLALTLYHFISKPPIKGHNGFYGKVKSVVEQSFGSDGVLLNKYIWDYDNSGNLTEFNLGPYSTKYSYDNNGKLLESKYVFKGKTYSNSYTYNDKGNLLNTHYYIDGKLDESNKDEYKYNERGNLIWSLESGEKCTYIYDAKDKIVEITKIRTDKDVWNFKYENSKTGVPLKCIMTFTTSSGTPPASEELYKYDKFYNKIESKLIDSKSTSVFKTEYNYDRNDNWVTKTDYYNGVASQVWRRKIVYY
jgi:YD repeat-containing protein